jgi:hypothetical protein
MKIAEFEVKIHPTKDKKNLKGGPREYEYGTINIRAPILRAYVGKRVKVVISV